MTKRYTGLAIILHWLIAIGIFINLAYGLSFDSLHDSQLRSALDIHKSIGISLLGLVILRILWRAGHQPPALPIKYRRWEIRLSTGIHRLLYALILLVPLSGWLHDSAWKGAASHPLVLFHTVPWFRIPLFNGLGPVARDHAHDVLGNVHSALAWGMMAALVLHVAGALKHQFIDRDKELQRMWFAKR